MDQTHPQRAAVSIERLVLSDVTVLLLIALARFTLHMLTNGAYGFYRDELATIDDARYLAWGYVAYPPFAPFVARLAFTLFGPSVVGLRLFVALAHSIVTLLAGLIARELGGPRRAQVLAAFAAAIVPVSLVHASLFEYVSFDYLWWVLIAYLTIRLLKSDDPRWWIGIGAVIGLGMMTRYTMILLVVGIVAAVLLTPTRRHLRSPWLWGGVALSLLIFLPNLIWQAQHDFVALEFTSSIHARDIEWGRMDDFWIQQLIGMAHPNTIPLWIAGLYFFFGPGDRRFRMLGWMAVIPFALFVATNSRHYYTMPIYPPLLAAGAVLFERWLAALATRTASWIRGIAWGVWAIGGVMVGAMVLPLPPVGSEWWDITSELNDTLVEKIGWPELAQTAADVYEGLPPEERARTAIFTANYGEAGAVNLYGPDLGLPEAISGVNSYWYRGYGDPPPETLIVLGYDQAYLLQYFQSCEAAGEITNPYGVRNEETAGNPIIQVCRQPRMPWPDLWKELQHFG